MADTKRSLSDLLTLFADNTSGQISPQDFRDGVVSWFGCYGEMQVTDGATAQSSLSSTPAKMTGWDTDGVSSGVVADSTTDNDLTVPVAGNYRVYFHLSFTPDASEDYTFEVYKNGSGTAIKCYIEANATPDDVAVSMEGIVTCAASDLLTIYVATTGGTASMTPTQGQFGAHLIG